MISTNSSERFFLVDQVLSLSCIPNMPIMTLHLLVSRRTWPAILSIFLSKHRYNFDSEIIQNRPKKNVSATQEIKWYPYLSEEVKDSEKMALIRYDYV